MHDLQRNVAFYRNHPALLRRGCAMSALHRAHYVASAHGVHELLSDVNWEVAFAGRSNSGKSSAINTIANRHRLAFASKTPGRTQLINFFGLGDDRFLVDLPGYGFAKVPQKERRHWGEFVGDYIRTRVSLRGLIVIMDVRHPMTPLDLQLLDWFLPTGKPVHVLLTKADKLSRQQATAQLASVRKALAARGGVSSASLFSSLKRTGIHDVETVILPWLGLVAAAEAVPAP